MNLFSISGVGFFQVVSGKCTPQIASGITGAARYSEILLLMSGLIAISLLIYAFSKRYFGLKTPKKPLRLFQRCFPSCMPRAVPFRGEPVVKRPDKMGYKIVVCGATGNVGREMLNILAERQFPVDEIAALASRRSLGTEVSFGDKTLTTKDLAAFDFSGWDIALFAIGSSATKEFTQGRSGRMCSHR